MCTDYSQVSYSLIYALTYGRMSVGTYLLTHSLTLDSINHLLDSVTYSLTHYTYSLNHLLTFIHPLFCYLSICSSVHLFIRSFINPFSHVSSHSWQITFSTLQISLLLSIILTVTSSNGATLPPRTSPAQATTPRERLPSSNCVCALEPRSNQSGESINLKIDYNVFLHGLPTLVTHVQRVKVFCRTGYFLAVEDGKKVVGTTNMSSDDKSE